MNAMGEGWSLKCSGLLWEVFCTEKQNVQGRAKVLSSYSTDSLEQNLFPSTG